MAESSAADRTEEPTARRLAKAREDGQVARSIELPAAAIVIGTFALIAATGGVVATRLADLFAAGFRIDTKVLQSPALMPGMLGSMLIDAFVAVLPLVVLTIVLAIVASGVTGGYLFSLKAVAPKAARLDPVEGLKRMFGPRAWVELGKSLAKFLLVAAVLWWLVVTQLGSLTHLGRMAVEPALHATGELIARSSLIVALTLALIAFADVPYQRWEFMKRMRMSKQEIKDEMKDVEGRPEVKAQIRRRQREMASARMMQRIKDADVLITNPEHFAVALEYDIEGDGAPVLVAKGSDHLAARIRERAAGEGVCIVPAPELARALYFTTELEQPIPEPLYRAVSEVLAYVFNLEAAHPGDAPLRQPRPTVPPAMRFDAEGRLQADTTVDGQTAP